MSIQTEKERLKSFASNDQKVLAGIIILASISAMLGFMIGVGFALFLMG